MSEHKPKGWEDIGRSASRFHCSCGWASKDTGPGNGAAWDTMCDFHVHREQHGYALPKPHASAIEIYRKHGTHPNPLTAHLQRVGQVDV